ncbi:3-methyl-2-oxobutanoate hydroxymethyltransferase [Raineyella fluvialis]|uniref:3-methyl-2-oxobutanoate hydroxymethyltransferase n=1 Tax=Raineyella fluvialis TaxID=2662261 RepID=A0A5Q2FEA3_9ACTN|nr:3-methyl-2-oxobutanoate hydroxymethyltransferase [Raineyella fluvialis]QGF24137.1 3-methyl-2-oxobutanoate hydroxymethyltransferase [Raineyella fluvialis]
MRTSIADIRAAYLRGERIPMITAYDYTSAQLVEQAGVPMILVGDSLGMVVQGHDSTLPVTVDDMIYHSRAVIRGCATPMVVTDLPFLTYATETDALRHAARLLAEGGATSVKLEGGRPVAPTVRRLVQAGIPVMGHLGFTPQSVNQIGMRVQAKESAAARELIEDALALQAAGAWAIVLELIPAPLATAVTAQLDIPTIGIGAGPGCSGEVQVWHDLLGLFSDFVPRHTRRYRTLAEEITSGLREYADDVRSGAFPTEKNSAAMDPAVLAEALYGLDRSAETEG